MPIPETEQTASQTKTLQCQPPHHHSHHTAKCKKGNKIKKKKSLDRIQVQGPGAGNAARSKKLDLRPEYRVTV